MFRGLWFWCFRVLRVFRVGFGGRPDKNETKCNMGFDSDTFSKNAQNS